MECCKCHCRPCYEVNRLPGVWIEDIVQWCKNYIVMKVVEYESNPNGERPFEVILVKNHKYMYGENDTILWLQQEDTVTIDLSQMGEWF